MRYAVDVLATLLATLVLVFPALLTDAEAQRHGVGGGASAVPHISAPAPHFSAPTPHMSGPRFSAPHVATPPPAAPHLSAPAPHMSTPRFSAPHVKAPTPHFAGPHNAAPHISPRSAAPHRPPCAIACPAPLPGELGRMAGSRDTTLVQRYPTFHARQDSDRLRAPAREGLDGSCERHRWGRQPCPPSSGDAGHGGNGRPGFGQCQ